jgi:chromosome segregation ATPase
MASKGLEMAPDTNTTEDRFQQFEEKFARAIEVFRQLQREKSELQRDVDRLLATGREESKRRQVLEAEVQSLEREREQVRSRIERLIEQIDLLTKSESAG